MFIERGEEEERRVREGERERRRRQQLNCNQKQLSHLSGVQFKFKRFLYSPLVLDPQKKW